MTTKRKPTAPSVAKLARNDAYSVITSRIENSPSVLALFAGNPFPDRPPTQVRTVLWQYWFTDHATRRATGLWWRRRELGPFTGVLTRGADGKLILAGSP